jgi:hypothetical protein
VRITHLGFLSSCSDLEIDIFTILPTVYHFDHRKMSREGESSVKTVVVRMRSELSECRFGFLFRIVGDCGEYAPPRPQKYGKT